MAIANSEPAPLLAALFCECGSHRVDQNARPAPGVIELRCYACGAAATVRGFLVGRVGVSDAQLAAARDDVTPPRSR